MVTTPNPDRWLTAGRLRAHAMVIALCLWSVYVWTLATPGLRDRNGNVKGTDFLHLYTLGSLALERRGADLYNMEAQDAVVAARVPQASGVRYLPLYPPQVAIFFMPLAGLSYSWALAAWWALSIAIYGLCCFKIWRACPNLLDYRSVVAIAAIAFPGFFHLIAWGQTSALALAGFTLMFFLLREQRDFAAGLVLGLLIFKPQLGLAAAIVFGCIGAWKILAGAVFSAAAELGVGVLYFGLAPVRQWIVTLENVRSVLPWLEPRPYQTHSLRTFWFMLIAWHNLALVLYIASTLTILALTVAIWRHKPRIPLALRYSALLLATVLVAPHLTVYDLIILAPVFLLMADWLLGQGEKSRPRSWGTLLYFIYVLPLLAPLVRWTHVQYSVIAMGAAVCVIYGRTSQNVNEESAVPVAAAS